MTATDSPTADPSTNGGPQRRGFGIDVGGSGVKGAIVDLETGQLIGERFKLETPQPATPEAVAKTVAAVVKEFGWTEKLGVTYPGVVTDGIVRTAANVDKRWLGVNIHDVFGAALDGQGGGERGGKPEVHTERVHAEAGPDGAVRVELPDDAG